MIPQLGAQNVLKSPQLLLDMTAKGDIHLEKLNGVHLIMEVQVPESKG